MKKLVFARRSSQIFFLLLFIYILWSVRHLSAVFKIDPLVSIFNPFSLAMLALTLVLGRFFCGWVCPLGAIIDMCGIRAKNRDLGLRQVKYYILGAIVVAAFLGIQIAWIFDPIVITARFISLNLIPSLTLALDRLFIFLIKGMNFYAPLYDFYRSLKLSILGAKIYYFPHSFVTLSFFIIICGLVSLTKRFWCRVICPLGAIYSLTAKFSLLSRRVDECEHCMKCKVNCRMSAIKEDTSYRKGECILCMDCVYDCPTHSTKFTPLQILKDSLLVICKLRSKDSDRLIDRHRKFVTGFTWPVKKAQDLAEDGISRRDFLFLIASSFLLSGFKDMKEWAGRKLIRPPGVMHEQEFLDKCIRCGNCMRACPTNALQPVIFESELAGIWAPHLVPEIGYCEYNCNLCGNVCPTGAIPRLSLPKKKEQKLGLAYIDKNICIPWLQNKECIVCEEHCPVPSKAIKAYEEVFSGNRIKKPYVDNSLCIGCGICQNKCPTRPLRAIRVLPG